MEIIEYQDQLIKKIKRSLYKLSQSNIDTNKSSLSYFVGWDVSSGLTKIRSQINIDDLNKKIEKLKKLKVLILGETIIDKYVFCEALGKSGKEPHLVLRDLNEQTYSGGVIAVAKNLADFCKKITIIPA